MKNKIIGYLFPKIIKIVLEITVGLLFSAFVLVQGVEPLSTSVDALGMRYKFIGYFYFFYFDKNLLVIYFRKLLRLP